MHVHVYSIRCLGSATLSVVMLIVNMSRQGDCMFHLSLLH